MTDVTINYATNRLTVLDHLGESVQVNGPAKTVIISTTGLQGAIGPEGPPGSSDGVGTGDVLPANNATYELFDLENNGTLPNATYRWDNQALVWVMN